jgi:hypothetical protein
MRTLACTLALLLGSAALAAPPLSGVAQAEDTNSAAAKSSWLWGEPARNGLYLGMWSYHLNEESRKDNREEHHLAGLSYNGYYAGTFLNSHNDRVWAAGIQRTVARQQYGELSLEAGYRLGLMHGYDERLSSLAGRIPLFPLLQLTLDAYIRNVGVQLSWAGSVLAAGFTYRF